MPEKDYGTAKCPICGKTFKKRRFNHVACCHAHSYQLSQRNAEARRPKQKYTWVLDMISWKWAKK